MTSAVTEKRIVTVELPPTNCMLQGHTKIVQRTKTNSGAQASEDNSNLAA
jgi:hypothetical protein